MIIRGDGTIGRYGTFSPDQVMPIAVLAEFLDGAATINVNVNGRFYYEKCEYNEKVLFFPSAPNVVTCYRNMYLNGTAFSNDRFITMSPAMVASAPVIEQGKLLLHDGHVYRPRLMTRDDFIYLHCGFLYNRRLDVPEQFGCVNHAIQDVPIAVQSADKSLNLMALSMYNQTVWKAAPDINTRICMVIEIIPKLPEE